MSTESQGELDTIEFRSPVDWQDLDYITINGFGPYHLYRHGFRRFGKKAAQRAWNGGDALPHAP